MFSLYNFTSINDIPHKEYSKLKFGSIKSAEFFGQNLAKAFYSNHRDVFLSNRVVVIPSPYNIVENAATILTKEFVDKINELLVEDGGNVVDYHIIRRKVSYINDYGFLSKKERKNLIDNDEFYLNKEYLKGATLIFIDDVKISGTHEDKLKELLEKEGMENITHYLYIAQYQGSEFDIEAKLNFSAINSLEDYAMLTSSEDIKPLVRPIKYFLSRSEDELFLFVNKFSDKFLSKVYLGALAEGYFRIPSYQENLKFLKERHLHYQKKRRIESYE